MTPETLRQSPAFTQLRQLAQQLGEDPSQIQGPGGNVSIKEDGVMLVKASGTWLADAMGDDIFTAVDSAAMKAAVEAGDASADAPQSFQIGAGLKPSIETGFHAALDAPVVLHTHCVAALARSTAPISTAELDALGLVRVDYAKPGADVARAICEAWRPGARGCLLTNHGIIAAGETVEEANQVLRDVAAAFDVGPIPQAAPAAELAKALEGSGWQSLGPGSTTALAFDEDAMALATGAALFPDQVIFLGPRPFKALTLPITPPDGPPASLALLPGRGAAVPEGASPALIALAEMMGDVIFRLPGNPTRLTEDETLELLDWDAEKHRQALELARTARLDAGDSA